MYSDFLRWDFSLNSDGVIIVSRHAIRDLVSCSPDRIPAFVVFPYGVAFASASRQSPMRWSSRDLLFVVALISLLTGRPEVVSGWNGVIVSFVGLPVEESLLYFLLIRAEELVVQGRAELSARSAFRSPANPSARPSCRTRSPTLLLPLDQSVRCGGHSFRVHSEDRN